MAQTGAIAQRVDAETASRPSLNEAGIDAVLRRLIHKGPSESGMEVTTSSEESTEQSTPRRDFDMTTELLDRAGQAFDLLIKRCQAFEHDMDEANERAQKRATEQDEAIEQWKQLAANLKAQLATTEQAMASLRARCDTVQARAMEAEATVKALQAASVQAASHAAHAESQSIKLHDKVVAIFGIGSRAHPVLEVVATKIAAE